MMNMNEYIFPEGGGKEVLAGRPFKLKVKERFFLMLLVYYRLYITYIHFQDFHSILIKAIFEEICL